MTFNEFEKIDARFRTLKPKLFLLSTPAAKATEAMINATEKALGLRLPEKYGAFLMEFGGGEYGLLNVFSADSEDEWYLPKKHVENRRVLPDHCLAFSDDLTGGYYILKIHNDLVQDMVFYWNSDERSESITPFADVLEFVARYAY